MRIPILYGVQRTEGLVPAAVKNSLTVFRRQEQLLPRLRGALSLFMHFAAYFFPGQFQYFFYNYRKNDRTHQYGYNCSSILNPTVSDYRIRSKSFQQPEYNHMGKVNFHADRTEEFCKSVLEYPAPVILQRQNY